MICIRFSALLAPPEIKYGPLHFGDWVSDHHGLWALMTSRYCDNIQRRHMLAAGHATTG